MGLFNFVFEEEKWEQKKKANIFLKFFYESSVLMAIEKCW